jgi:Zn-dependent protease
LRLTVLDLAGHDDAEVRTVPIFEDRSGFAREVEEELHAMESSPKHPMRSVLILIASLALFIGFQLVGTSVSGVLILMVVLLVHECGHLVAMKLIGYRDVQMFFIPLFGAAVSGAETVPSGTRRAVVALAGPVPGIALGLLCTVLFHVSGRDIFSESARTFLLLNTFNLLPFSPLDGGRFMEAVVSARHPMLKAVFDVIAGVALGVLAWKFGSVIYALLAFVVILLAPFAYRASQLARNSKAELAFEGGSPIGAPAAPGSSRIPAQYVERLIPLIEPHLDEAHRTPKHVAMVMRNLWNLMWFRPPSFIVSIGLLIAYGVCFGLGVMAILGAETLFRPTRMPR